MATKNGTSASQTTLTDVWTADELMGNGAPIEKANSGERRRSSSLRALTRGGNKDKVEPADWGRPGHLTQDEVDVYVSSFTVEE